MSLDVCETAHCPAYHWPPRASLSGCGQCWAEVISVAHEHEACLHGVNGTTPGMDPRGGNPRSAHEGHDFLQTHTPTATAAQCASYIYSLESFTISDCEAPRACPQAKWLVVREDCATTHACLSSSAANGCGTGFGHLSFSIAVRASVIAGKIDWLRYTRTLSL